MQIICAINKNSALVESNISLALAADSHIFAINSAKHQLKQHHGAREKAKTKHKQRRQRQHKKQR